MEEGEWDWGGRGEGIDGLGRAEPETGWGGALEEGEGKGERYYWPRQGESWGQVVRVPGGRRRGSDSLGRGRAGGMRRKNYISFHSIAFTGIHASQ